MMSKKPYRCKGCNTQLNPEEVCDCGREWGGTICCKKCRESDEWRIELQKKIDEIQKDGRVLSITLGKDVDWKDIERKIEKFNER